MGPIRLRIKVGRLGVKTALLSCFILSCGAAEADQSFLSNYYNIQISWTSTAVRYDECVKQGFLKDSGPSKLSQYQALIEATKEGKRQVDKPTDVTNAQIADAMQQALNFWQQQSGSEIIRVSTNQDMCKMTQDNWNSLIQYSGSP